MLGDGMTLNEGLVVCMGLVTIFILGLLALDRIGRFIFWLGEKLNIFHF